MSHSIGRRSLMIGALSAGSAAALSGAGTARARTPAPVATPDQSPAAAEPGESTSDAHRRIAPLEQAIWKSAEKGTRVWGYADKHSIVPGEGFSIMLSSGPGIGDATGQLEIYRIGFYRDGDRKLVWRAPASTGRQPVEATAAALGLEWPVAAKVGNTAEWRSGFYAVDFVHAADCRRDANVAFIVVTNPEKSGDVLVWLSTNTYQAYNEWGGYSLYASSFVGDRAQMVSFDRPTPADFFSYEYYFVLWVERLAAVHRFRVDYATNFDLHRDAGFAENCRLLVSGSHNEYWSKEEFGTVHRRIFELGKNTMFLGANSAYWQVRYADLDNPTVGDGRGRQLICYKSGFDPIRARLPEGEAMRLITARFRDYARLPETMLAGIAYQSYFPADSQATYPYHIHDLDFPFFAGTGCSVGEAVAEVVGYEWDNRDPDGDGKRLWDPAKSLIPALDAAVIRVVLTGFPVDLNGRSGRAEAVYFVSPAGARVFSTGSIRWAWGLGKPGFLRKKFKLLNRNLLMHLLGSA